MQPPSSLRMPSASSRTDLAAIKKKSTSVWLLSVRYEYVIRVKN